MIQLYLSSNLEFAMSDQIQELTQRKPVVYTDLEIELTKQELETFSSSIQELVIIARANNKKIINDNQLKTSLEVVKKFENPEMLGVMVIAKTQSGKTGCQLSVIHQMMHRFLIPQKNISIVTALSSVDWKEQTKERMPREFKGKVCHQQDLDARAEELSEKKDILIVMDEVQIAAQVDQALHNFFKKLGIVNEETGNLDRNKMYSRNIKIVQFSATPDGVLYDLLSWGKEASATIFMKPGENYTSSFDLISQNRMFQYKNLTGKEKLQNEKNIKEFKDKIIEISGNDYGYSIVRTPSENEEKTQYEELKKSLVKVFKKDFSIVEINQNTHLKVDQVCDIIGLKLDEFPDYEYYKKLEKKKPNEKYFKDINLILSIKPQKHVVFLVKELYRCSKTLTKTHLKVLYERYVENQNDSVIVQGLAGRASGYDDNGKTVVFTNIPSIRKYNCLFESGFDIKQAFLNYKATTISNKNGIMTSKGTMNKVEDPYEIEIEKREIEIKIFESFEELCEFHEKILKPTVLEPREKLRFEMGDTSKVKKFLGPTDNEDTLKKDSEGFILTNLRENYKRLSLDEAITQDLNCNIDNDAGYGRRYAYVDKTDINSKFYQVIIYHKFDPILDREFFLNKQLKKLWKNMEDEMKQSSRFIETQKKLKKIHDATFFRAFDNIEDVKKFIKEKVSPISKKHTGKGKNCPRVKNEQKDGEFIITEINKKKIILDEKTAKINKSVGMKNSGDIILRVAYKNLEDPSSMIWCLSFYRFSKNEP